MIKAIIFDLDGMIYFTEERFSDWFSKKYNIHNEHIQEFFKTDFKKCLIGELDTKEALKPHLENWNWKDGAEEFLNIWFEYGKIDNEILTLIEHLKEKNIKCILCTNNEKYRVNHFKTKFGFENVFDLVVSSAKAGHKKPYKEIFQMIIDKTNLKKQEFLFCDDDEKNIEGAKEFGFKTHHYNDLIKFKKNLTELDLL